MQQQGPSSLQASVAKIDSLIQEGCASQKVSHGKFINLHVSALRQASLTFKSNPTSENLAALQTAFDECKKNKTSSMNFNWNAITIAIHESKELLKPAQKPRLQP